MADPVWKVVLQRPMVIASLVLLTISYMNIKMYNKLESDEKTKWENKACLYLNAALIILCVSLIACNFISSKKECSFTDLLKMPFKTSEKKQAYPNSPIGSPVQNSPYQGLGGNRRISPRRYMY
tara:strand:+ start:1852 stop:2223 length:372 start_codon:yes stop_codon:yes gene_type:complete